MKTSLKNTTFQSPFSTQAESAVAVFPESSAGEKGNLQEVSPDAFLDTPLDALFEAPLETAPAVYKPKLKRLHQDTCGTARMEYDGYDDVREACERKLREWERAGIIPPWRPMASNDWIFAR